MIHTYILIYAHVYCMGIYLYKYWYLQVKYILSISFFVDSFEVMKNIMAMFADLYDNNHKIIWYVTRCWFIKKKKNYNHNCTIIKASKSPLSLLKLDTPQQMLCVGQEKKYDNFFIQFFFFLYI